VIIRTSANQTLACFIATLPISVEILVVLLSSLMWPQPPHPSMLVRYIIHATTRT